MKKIILKPEKRECKLEMSQVHFGNGLILATTKRESGVVSVWRLTRTDQTDKGYGYKLGKYIWLNTLADRVSSRLFSSPVKALRAGEINNAPIIDAIVASSTTEAFNYIQTMKDL